MRAKGEGDRYRILRCWLSPSSPFNSFHASRRTLRRPRASSEMATAATSMVLSLVGLQALRKRAITKGEPTRGELLQELCEPLLDLARSGRLSHAMALRLLSGAIVGDAESEVVRALSSKKKLPSILRFLFTSKVSWAVFTTEWIDGVAAFLTTLGLHGKRVLEVCAGENTLAAPMRARGFDVRGCLRTAPSFRYATLTSARLPCSSSAAYAVGGDRRHLARDGGVAAARACRA